MSRYHQRDAVLLAMAFAEDEGGKTLLGRTEAFIKRLIDYDYQVVPIETVDKWARTNVQPVAADEPLA